jgi:formate-dependent nitrite reductase membrane component NrfD
MDSAIRVLRIVHGALLGAAFLYVFMAEKLNEGREPKSTSVIYMAIAVMAVAVVVISFVFRIRMVGSSEEKLRLDATDATALARWRAGNVVTLALAESVVLYGLVLRFVGATTAQAVPFYLAGIAMLLLFTPRRP